MAQGEATDGARNDAEPTAQQESGGIRIRPYAGEIDIETVMKLIDSELSEPYTIYTYRFFLNEWPELCFLAYADGHTGPSVKKTDRSEISSSSSSNMLKQQQKHGERAIGVVIGKLDRHIKGQRNMRGYIGMISVEHEFRGKGIAKRMLHITLAEMVKRGAQEIVLETECDNVASLRLYESLGFMPEKRLFNFYLNGKDCFRLVLQLPPSVWQPFDAATSVPSSVAQQIWRQQKPVARPRVASTAAVATSLSTSLEQQRNIRLGPEHDSPPQNAFSHHDIL